MHLLALELRKILSCEAFLDAKAQTKTFLLSKKRPLRFISTLYCWLCGFSSFVRIIHVHEKSRSNRGVITVMNKLSYRTVIPLCNIWDATMILKDAKLFLVQLCSFFQSGL